MLFLWFWLIFVEIFREADQNETDPDPQHWQKQSTFWVERFSHVLKIAKKWNEIYWDFEIGNLS